jgi:hypothetical protein
MQSAALDSLHRPALLAIRRLVPRLATSGGGLWRTEWWAAAVTVWFAFGISLGEFFHSKSCLRSIGISPGALSYYEDTQPFTAPTIRIRLSGNLKKGIARYGNKE